MLKKIKNLLWIIILLPFALVFFAFTMQAISTGLDKWEATKTETIK